VLIEQLSRIASLGTEWVLWLLLALSVVSLTSAVERIWFFARNGASSRRLRSALEAAVQGEQFDALQAAVNDSASAEARVLRRALSFASGGADAVASAVDSAWAAEKPALERGLTLLGTIGNNAPFVGLFGTVIGVIDAFRALGEAGGKDSAMAHVLHGISEALVSTGVGIFVALPAVVAYNLVQKRVGDIETETTSLAKLLEAWLHRRAAAKE
jgi:biopolymer transport protein ExbB/biopolymer transport protein TolQ